MFEVAVAEYMEDRARRLRRTTLEGYESAVRCHLAPRWAGREQPFAGGYLYRFGSLRVLQVQNMTLQANVPRTVGKLPVKPSREVVGAISYGTSAGYVSVHTDGTVICMAKAGGDFSGQVCSLAG